MIGPYQKLEQNKKTSTKTNPRSFMPRHVLFRKWPRAAKCPRSLNRFFNPLIHKVVSLRECSVPPDSKNYEYNEINERSIEKGTILSIIHVDVFKRKITHLIRAHHRIASATVVLIYLLHLLIFFITRTTKSAEKGAAAKPKGAAA